MSDDEFSLDTTDAGAEAEEHLYRVELHNCLPPQLDVVATTPDEAWEEFKRHTGVVRSKCQPKITRLD